MDLEKSTVVAPKGGPPHLKIGDVLVLGLKGLYKIEDQKKINFGDCDQLCFVLSLLFSKSQHKTFLPCENVEMTNVRLPSALKTVEKVLDPGFVENIKIDPLDFTINSNSKIQMYEKRIEKEGLIGLINAHLCIKWDIAKTGRMDKRYISFMERLVDLAAQEISFVKKIPIDKAREAINLSLKVTTSH